MTSEQVAVDYNEQPNHAVSERAPNTKAGATNANTETTRPRVLLMALGKAVWVLALSRPAFAKMQHREPSANRSTLRQARLLRPLLECWRSSRCSSSRCLRVRYVHIHHRN
jgi:hypothetical protein